MLNKTNKDAKVLDAGGLYSTTILPWLYAYGYRNLMCINPFFKKKKKIGSITYNEGDILNTTFPNNFFDVISCLSVIEHGLDMKEYFKETYRILKPGGFLITSTDYWPSKIDTFGEAMDGYPYCIFSKNEILKLFKLAKRTGFNLIENLDLSAEEKILKYGKFEFTFIYFVLQKGKI